jgi:hypothetical protein
MNNYEFFIANGYSKKVSKTVAIDFDGTLVERGDVFDEEIALKPGAKEVIKKLYERGYRIVIFTSRLSSWFYQDLKRSKGWDAQYRYVMSVLRRHDLLKYIYSVTGEKIPARIYIDDLAVRFTSWEDIERMFDGDEQEVEELDPEGDQEARSPSQAARRTRRRADSCCKNEGCSCRTVRPPGSEASKAGSDAQEASQINE